MQYCNLIIGSCRFLRCPKGDRNGNLEAAITSRITCVAISSLQHTVQHWRSSGRVQVSEHKYGITELSPSANPRDNCADSSLLRSRRDWHRTCSVKGEWLRRTVLIATNHLHKKGSYMSRSIHNYSPESGIRNGDTRSSADAAENRFKRSEVASRAYDLWQSRGRPDGSAEEDWLEAEREVETQETGTQP